MGWNRLRTYALVASVALLSTLVVVPAFGNDHLTDIDAVEFTAVDGVPRFEYGGLTQLLTTPQNTCAIVNPDDGDPDATAENILNLEGTGGVPGLAGNSIGVRTSGRNANGTPCSQIESREILTITPGLELPGAAFSKVRLDLEVTGNAIVVLTLSDGAGTSSEFILKTGTNVGDTPVQGTEAPYLVNTGPDDDPTTACAAAASSGPNSHANDNCIWTVEPGHDFTSIALTVTVGTVSLEGGSDTGAANTSLFYLAPDRLNCGTERTFSGPGEPTLTVLAKNGDADCFKDFTYTAGLRGVDADEQFVELVASGTPVVFLEKLEFMPFDGSNQITQSLYYDDLLLNRDSPTLAQFCLLDPRVVAADTDLGFVLHGDYDTPADAPLVLPGTETTCIIHADFLTTGSAGGASQVVPVYYLYNVGDGFRTFK
ncbi:MAG TPA: hypothetical protein VMS74_14335 [Acidimicrobiia bacterium]|nr:hypothetical protein [Acidimicrobiia bacterium]